jgi:hypothetical protein
MSTPPTSVQANCYKTGKTAERWSKIAKERVFHTSALMTAENRALISLPWHGYGWAREAQHSVERKWEIPPNLFYDLAPVCGCSLGAMA